MTTMPTPTMLNQKALGRAIRAAREDAGLTLDALAARMNAIEDHGWTKGDLQGRESGRIRAKAPDLRLIAQALGKTISQIEDYADVVSGDSENVGRIPLINFAPAGPAADYCEWGSTSHDAPEYIDPAGLSGADLFAVRIRGDSMQPKFYDYDVVVFRWLNPHVDGGHTPIRDGAIVFVRYSPERDSLCTVGRWWLMRDGSIQIRKDNPRHGTIVLRREDIEQVGRFVQHRTERED